jgi:hypothetical protein
MAARKVNTIGVGLLVLFMASPALSQQVPDITDVYAVGPDTHASLGPTSDPDEVFDRALRRLAACSNLSYDAHLTASARTVGGIVEVWASLVFGKSVDGTFAYSRITLEARDDGNRTFLVTLVGRDDSLLIIDRTGRRYVETTRSQAGRIERLVDALSLPGIDNGDWGGVEFLGRSGEKDEPTYTIHFFDRMRAEHLYGRYSRTDGWPRAIDRIVAGPDGRAGVISTRVSRLTTGVPVAADTFDMTVPDGFRQVEELELFAR